MRFPAFLAASAIALAFATAPTAAPACATDNAGLKLPSGFCATLFADSLAAPTIPAVASGAFSTPAP